MVLVSDVFENYNRFCTSPETNSTISTLSLLWYPWRVNNSSVLGIPDFILLSHFVSGFKSFSCLAHNVCQLGSAPTVDLSAQHISDLVVRTKMIQYFNSNTVNYGWAEKPAPKHTGLNCLVIQWITSKGNGTPGSEKWVDQLLSTFRTRSTG